MSLLNYFGVILILLLIAGVGLYSGRQVSSVSDFSTGGGRGGPWLVCGGIMGALVSSQASIGTAQLAFQYGMAAWWFTLGSGIGCLLLALGYVAPLRSSGCTTLMSIIHREYGAKAKNAGSILSSIGIFISVLAQVVACTGLVTVIFPVSIPVAAGISVALMAVYVIFGGALGAGMAGVVKLILLTIMCLLGLVIVLVATHGPGGLVAKLMATLSGTPLGELSGLTTSAEVAARYGSLVARGVAKDIGSGISLLLGVLSTQTYAQAVWSAKSDQAARRGSLMAALLIPPIGVAGIVIGIFMRGHYVTQAELEALLAAGKSLPEGMGVIASTIQVFPAFVTNHLPPLVTGMVLGTLLITVVGGGAGLSHGVSTIIVNDILKHIWKRMEDPKFALVAARTTILAALIVSALIACSVPSAIINDFGFLSMGLRGAVVFFPLSCALFFPNRVDRRCALGSVVFGPIGVILGKVAGVSIDPLFIGMTVSLAFMLAGFALKGTAGGENGSTSSENRP